MQGNNEVAKPAAPQESKEEESTEQQKQQKNAIAPPSLTFALMTLTNILINLDHGILPACTGQMQQHFQMSEAELGFLGSIVYLGIVVMGTLAGHLYLRFDSKRLTLIALVLLEGTLGLFVLSDHKWTAYVSRFLTGTFQVFLLVYYPVWIDKFGGDKKTLWLTLLQVCVPIGIFAGYGITAGVLQSGQQYTISFYIQIALVAVFIIGFSLVPKAKLDCRRVEDHQENFMDSVPAIHQNFIDAEVLSPHSVASAAEKEKLIKKKKYKYTEMMKKLIKSKMYLVGTLTMATILFVSTGIQFWLTDYFIKVLHFDPWKVHVAYGVVSITGPTSGCGFGGVVLNKIGGYDNPKTVYLVFLFACIGIGSAVIIPFVDEFYTVASLLWLVLFFGGAMMPGLTGIMMVSVPPYLRAFGNSNGEIIKNIFGYLPAPFLYGWFQVMFGERAGIKLIMFWGLLAPFLLGLGSLHRYRQLKKQQKDIEDLKEPVLSSQYSIPSEESIESPRKQQKVDSMRQSLITDNDEVSQKVQTKQKEDIPK